MKFKEYQHKKVLIMGLGQNQGGLGAAQFFAEQGARVVVTDLKTEHELRHSLKALKSYHIEYVLGQHRERDFQRTDLIIKNPAVPDISPYIKIARENNIEIDTDIGIFFSHCKVPIIAITGTKGKTTTTSLVAEILKRQYPNVILAGNLQISVLGILEKITSSSIVVLEISSFGLEGLIKHKKGPQIGCITNIYQDHLNRYDNMGNYLRAKEIIFQYQSKNDSIVLNHEINELHQSAKKAPSRVVWFYPRVEKSAQPVKGVFFQGDDLIASGFSSQSGRRYSQDKICLKSDISIQGKHNESNVLAAVAVCLIADVKLNHIREALARFKGVSSRNEIICSCNDLLVVNDTASTIPEATKASLTMFSKTRKNIILISGGSDKGLDLRVLATDILRFTAHVILLPGNATKKLQLILENGIKKQHHPGFSISFVKNMEQAVDIAREKASSGDVILLSPGLTSFGLFQNEFDRGNTFVTYVRKHHDKKECTRKIS